MKSYLIILFLVLGFILPTSLFAKVVYYSEGGNFKALVHIPPNYNKKMPVIVYNYDQFYDWAGSKLAEEKGYNLEAFAKKFEEWGYITIIPLERYRKIQALKGAIYLARQLEESNGKVHLVGVSEGAILSLLAFDSFHEVNSLVLISPQNIHYTGKLSIPNVVQRMALLDMPVLFISSPVEKKWRVAVTEVLSGIFEQYQKNVIFVEYPVTRKWFWSPKNKYMDDIRNFLLSHP